ncbi:MAG: DUF11 domain-containing protein [Xanthomonadales bacterium]|nr:DUF11 domain-containing protein [Xanthomonadales bacterium]
MAASVSVERLAMIRRAVLLIAALLCAGAVSAQTADQEVVSVAISQNPVVPGQTVTYTFVIRNNGPDAAANGGLNILYYNGNLLNATFTHPPGWSCITFWAGAGCNIASLPAGTTATITLTAQVDPSRINFPDGSFDMTVSTSGVTPNQRRQQQSDDHHELEQPADGSRDQRDRHARSGRAGHGPDLHRHGDQPRPGSGHQPQFQCLQPGLRALQIGDAARGLDLHAARGRGRHHLHLQHRELRGRCDERVQCRRACRRCRARRQQRHHFDRAQRQRHRRRHQRQQQLRNREHGLRDAESGLVRGRPGHGRSGAARPGLRLSGDAEQPRPGCCPERDLQPLQQRQPALPLDRGAARLPVHAADGRQCADPVVLDAEFRERCQRAVPCHRTHRPAADQSADRRHGADERDGKQCRRRSCAGGEQPGGRGHAGDPGAVVQRRLRILVAPLIGAAIPEYARRPRGDAAIRCARCRG